MHRRALVCAALAMPLLAVVDAGCSTANIVDGKIRALCTDTLTGYDFEYLFSTTLLDKNTMSSIKSNIVNGDDINIQVTCLPAQ